MQSRRATYNLAVVVPLTCIGATTTKLRALRSRLVQLGIVPEEAAARLEDAIEECISEMARWSTALELLQAVEESGDA